MKRHIRIEGPIAYIPLTQGYEAIIDAADAETAQGFNWSAALTYRADGSLRSVYATTNVRRPEGGYRTLKLHRLLKNAESEVEVDHRDGNGLNNRRNNLRCASKAQNQFNRTRQVNNTSGAKGVNFDKKAQKWRARIRTPGNRISLGFFADAASAAAAYAAASAELHGEFGRTG